MKSYEDIGEKLERILSEVEKPARYTGGELYAVRKDWSEVRVKMAFAYPDVYEVGMSHLGGKILYGLVNENPEFLMERVFAPWPDMEQKMRRAQIPLFTLESGRPLKSFDVVGVSLQYELTYSNVINMLDMGGIPLFSEERSDDDPIVIAGGPCAFNPEPLAAFIDAFVIGDGEEVLPMILEKIKNRKEKGRDEILRELVKIPGVYVPSFHAVDYEYHGRVRKRFALEGPLTIKKAVVKDLDSAYYPTRPVVPYLGIVHDRAVLEVMRGCLRGCRFCQAGMVYRPVRERSFANLREQAREILRNTGYDEVSLASLSSADYSNIQALVRTINEEQRVKGVGVALPSLRADAFSVGLAEEVQRVRKTTLTFAPEAGTQRLRNVINKNVTEDDILSACEAAFASGWLGVKLYFMLGLPTETEKDLDGIVDLVKKIKGIGGKLAKRPPKITASLSYFVPKAHTPFQWERQVSIDDMREKKEYILSRGRMKNVTWEFHDEKTSFLEGILARGDRRLSKVLLLAWKKGARFDGWREYFSLEYYLEAMDELGLEPEWYVRERWTEEILPWDFIDCGVTKEFLLKEREKAYRAETTPDCREEGCQGCEICPRLEVEIKLKGEQACECESSMKKGGI